MSETEAFSVRPGRPLPFGASAVPGGVNFSIFSAHATGCTLVLFEKWAQSPLVEIQFPESFRIGNVWSMVVDGVEATNVEYAYRMSGPYDEVSGHRFDPTRLLLDPYAGIVSGREEWGGSHVDSGTRPYRGRLVVDRFDWEHDRPLRTAPEELVIYEAHLRGFTRHESSGVVARGTFAGMIDKISYLKELGVSCVELMPVYEFDELEDGRRKPETGGPLLNYWGYSAVDSFAPKASYAASAIDGRQSAEMKELVKQLHKAGIELFLDVAFNHTAEGNENGPCISFRGIDNKTYYMLTPQGYYFNFTGAGNTLNCNNPVVRNMVLDCLRYWAAEYHVDGFRFDLASIVGRDPWGAPQPNPTLLESLAFDPILSGCKLVTDSWEAGGLDESPPFRVPREWSEWNGGYRDTIRKFLKGDAGITGEVARRISGSADLFWGRGPGASINLITSHEGFTLADLVSYDRKHNDANGENNADGIDENFSWNCGVEGPTDDPAIRELRLRQSKNAIAILMVSQGVPMILMGDEVGRTQRGNNNAYCHDSDLTWLDWGLLANHRELFDFFRRCIAFRKAHPALRKASFPVGEEAGGNPPEISWHGTQAWAPDWSPYSRTLAFMLRGARPDAGPAAADIYVAMNMHWEEHEFVMPAPGEGKTWRLFANTGAAAPGDAHDPGNEMEMADQTRMSVGPRSVVILLGR